LSIVIRAVEKAAMGKLGRIVTRIELLSPSNKRGGGGSSAYQARRFEALEMGVPLIEIDLLHELPPVVLHHPIYPHEVGSHPYMIVINDPRPNFELGLARVFGFGVDEALPTLEIPLEGDDVLAFGFDKTYQQAFVSRRYQNLLDYGQPPVRFATYGAEDQARILARLDELAR
jgi:Protein of unknown function (DUF4058)